MNITSKNVTTTAEMRTANGIYEIEFSTVNNQFNRLVVTVFDLTDSQERAFIAQLSYEGGGLQCSFNKITDYSLIMIDFESILKEVETQFTEATEEKTNK